MVTQVAVGAPITASKTNELVDGVNEVGLVAVIPTVSGSGVTVSASGIVSFAASTAITVTNPFTADFRNYEIKFDSSGTAGGVTLQLRVGGVTSVTNYDLTENLARNAAVSSSTALNQASWAISGGNSTRYAGSVTLFAPAIAIETAITSQVGQHANPAVSSTANALKVAYGTHRPLTAYDSFVLTFSAAQTGVLRVYGYN